VKRSIEEEYEKAMKTANLYQSLLSNVWEKEEKQIRCQIIF
jgi:hypothetical protein